MKVEKMMEKMIHDGNLRTIFQQEYLKYLNSVFARKFEYKSVSSKLENSESTYRKISGSTIRDANAILRVNPLKNIRKPKKLPSLRFRNC